MRMNAPPDLGKILIALRLPARSGLNRHHPQEQPAVRKTGGIHVGVLPDHVINRQGSESPETMDIPDGPAPGRETKKKIPGS